MTAVNNNSFASLPPAQVGVSSNANPTIIFDPSLAGHPIILGGSELPQMTQPVTVTGLGASQLSISGNGLSRIFNVGSTVAISGLTLTNGTADGGTGGAITNAGNLTLIDCVVSNSSTNSSGAIYNVGSLDLENCTITNNSSPGNDSGILSNSGNITINHSVIANNSNGGGSGAGLSLLYQSGNSFTVNLTSSVFANNTANNSGGGLFDSDVAHLNISDCTFASNTAGFGGGLSLITTNSLITATLTDCTISGNNASGGGLYAEIGPSSFGPLNVNLVQCTFTENSQNAVVGFSDSGSVNIRYQNSLFAGNANGNMVNLQGASLTSDGHNLFDDNTGNPNSSAGDLVTPNPLLGSLGNNGGPLVGASGNTQLLQTVALSPGSPAIAAGGMSTSNPISLPTTDERGFTRAGSPDIGAYQSQGFNYTQAGTPGSAVVSTTFSPLQLTILDGNNQPVSGLPVTFTIQPNSTGSTFAVGEGSSNTFSTTTDGKGIASTALVSLLAGTTPGTFTVLATVGTQSLSYTLTCLPLIFLVDRSSDDVNDGISNLTGVTFNGAPVYGEGSLRYCLAQVDTLQSGIVPLIEFNTSPVLLSNGELNLDRDVQLIGSSSLSQIQNSGTATNRLFQVATGVNVTLKNLDLSGGKATGSAPSNEGGGIFNDGNLTLINCYIHGNSANQGSAIFSDGTLDLENCTIASNNATDRGAVRSTAGNVTINNSLIQNNTSSGQAPGIDLQYVVNTSNGLSVNNALAARPTVVISNTAVLNNTTTGLGGGLFDTNANLTVSNSTFANNSAADGAGLAFEANATTTVTLTDCTISGNQDNGASIETLFDPSSPGTLRLDLVQCTVAGNTTRGVAAYTNSGSGNIAIHYQNSLFASNGLRNFDSGQLVQTGNPSPPGAITLISDGYNLSTDGTGNLTSTGDQANVSNPYLAQLASYGGPVVGATGFTQPLQTMALLPGSPAIGKGGQSTTTPITLPSTDERGDQRPGPSGLDIGAYQDEGFHLTSPSGSGQSAIVNQAFSLPLTLTMQDDNSQPLANIPVTFTIQDPNSTGSTFSGGATTVSTTTDSNGVASTAATLLVAGTKSGNFTVLATVGPQSFSYTLTCQPGPVASYHLMGPTSVYSGQAMTINVQPEDAYGNPTSNGLPASALLTSTDASGTTISIPFTSATSYPVNNFVLNTAGNQTIKLTDSGGNTLASGPVVQVLNPLSDLSIQPSSNPVQGNQAFTLMGSFSDALGSADSRSHTVKITWGDGSSDSLSLAAGVFSFSLSHSYHNGLPATNPASVSITAIISDVSGNQATTSTTQTVTDDPPRLNIDLTKGVVNVNSTFSRAGSFSAGNDDDKATLQVDWGDGSPGHPDVQSVSLNTEGTFSLQHTYTQLGTFLVTLSLKDGLGGQDSATFLVTSQPGPVASYLITAPTGVYSGQGMTISIQMKDQYGNPTSNGLPASALLSSSDASGTAISIPFTSATSYTVNNFVLNTTGNQTIKLTDSGGNTLASGPVVQVLNPLGNLSIQSSSNPVQGNQAFTLMGSFSDALGSADSRGHTVKITWGDGSSDSLSLAAGVFSFSLSHSYHDGLPTTNPASVPITALVSDVSGNRATTSTTQTVTDDPPRLNIDLSKGVVNVNSTFSRAGSFSAGNDDDKATLQVDWGDGSPGHPDVQSVSLNTDGTFSLQHTYTALGTFLVTLSLKDGLGGQDSATFLVTSQPGPVARYQIAAVPDSTSNGQGISLRILPLDAFGNATQNGLPASLFFTSSDNRATLPAAFPLSTATPNSAGVYTVSGFTLNRAGTQTINLTDDKGNVLASTQVMVTNQPSLTIAVNDEFIDANPDPNNPVNTQLPFTRSGLVSDGAETFTVTVDYGDGTKEHPDIQTVVVYADNSFTLEHFYQGEGDFKVTIILTDSLFGMDVKSFVVDVLLPGVPTAPAQKAIVDGGSMGTVSTTGVSLTLTNPGPLPVAILVADVPTDVVASLNGSFQVSAGTTLNTAYDVRVIGADNLAYGTVVLHYTASPGVFPTLTYRDANGHQVIIPLTPAEVNTDTQTITLQLGNNTIPRLQDLHGTVFSISVPVIIETPVGPSPILTVSARQDVPISFPIVSEGGHGGGENHTENSVGQTFSVLLGALIGGVTVGQLGEGGSGGGTDSTSSDTDARGTNSVSGMMSDLPGVSPGVVNLPGVTLSPGNTEPPVLGGPGSADQQGKTDPTKEGTADPQPGEGTFFFPEDLEVLHRPQSAEGAREVESDAEDLSPLDQVFAGQSEQEPLTLAVLAVVMAREWRNSLPSTTREERPRKRCC